MSDQRQELSLAKLLRREIEALSDRLGRRVTQQEISHDAKVSRKHLSELLNEKTGTEAETLRRIVDALKIEGIDRNARVDLIFHAAELLPPKHPQMNTEAASRLQTLYNGLNSDDQDDLMQLALTKWSRKYPDEGTLTSPSKILDDGHSSQLCYDMKEHKLYTHDGQPANEDLVKAFLLDVSVNMLSHSVADRQNEELKHAEIEYQTELQRRKLSP